jgi:hypothetical protein
VERDVLGGRKAVCTRKKQDAAASRKWIESLIKRKQSAMSSPLD